MDAYSGDVRATLYEAYRFARGEPITLPPLDAEGRDMRKAPGERPIDFAAVTDHASYLAPVGVHTQPNSPACDAPGLPNVPWRAGWNAIALRAHG